MRCCSCWSRPATDSKVHFDYLMINKNVFVLFDVHSVTSKLTTGCTAHTSHSFLCFVSECCFYQCSAAHLESKLFD